MTSFSIKTVAAAILEDPMFLALSDTEREDAARPLIRAAGRDPDPMTVSIVLSAAAKLASTPEPESAAPGPLEAPPPRPIPERLVAAVERRPVRRRAVLPLYAEAMGYSDMDLSEVLGVQRTTANQKRLGKMPENLSKLQLDSMIRALKERQGAMQKALDILRDMQDA